MQLQMGMARNDGVLGQRELGIQCLGSRQQIA